MGVVSQTGGGGQGSTNGRVVTVINNYNIQPEDGVILCDTTYNPITLTISDELLVSTNTIVVKDIGGNAENNHIVIAIENPDTKIDWSNSFVIEHNLVSVTLRNDSSNFFII